MEGSKVCTKCGVKKSLDEFYNDKKNRDGKQSQCKGCKHEYSIRYRNQNRHIINKKQRQKKLKEVENPERLQKIRRLKSLNTETHRCCLKCEQLKANSKFGKRVQRRKNGTEAIYYNSYCVRCTKMSLREWEVHYPERKMKRVTRYQRKSVELVSNSYCKALIRGGTELGWSEIPQELIELKRQMVLLYRVNKELKELQDKLNQ